MKIENYSRFAGRAWAGTTYGTGWMHYWLIRMLRYIDVRILYAFASVFVVPVCLVVNESRGIIYRYFRRHFGYSPVKALWKTYVNHCMFSQVVIDRFAMYAGKTFRIDTEGHEHFDALSALPSAFVQLSAHVGNYEIAGYTLAVERKPFNALVFWGEKESVMANRQKLFRHTNIRMIPLRSDLSHLFEIDRALNAGEAVSMPADRLLGSRKHVELDFLCGRAIFPMGPFSVATMRGLDVLAVNVMKTSLTTYRLYCAPLRYDKRAAREEQIRQLSEGYVRELERVVRMYPTQWYNYFEFWEE